jgi:hypothetical protein
MLKLSEKASAKVSTEALETLGVEVGQFEEEALARRGGHGAIDGEPLEDMLDRADGLHAAGGEAPSTHRQQAQAAFVLAEHAHRAGILRRADTL